TRTMSPPRKDPEPCTCLSGCENLCRQISVKRRSHVWHDGGEIRLLWEGRVEAGRKEKVAREQRTPFVLCPVRHRVAGEDVAGAAQEVAREPLAEGVRDVEEIVVIA